MTSSVHHSPPHQKLSPRHCHVINPCHVTTESLLSSRPKALRSKTRGSPQTMSAHTTSVRRLGLDHVCCEIFLIVYGLDPFRIRPSALHSTISHFTLAFTIERRRSSLTLIAYVPAAAHLATTVKILHFTPPPLVIVVVQVCRRQDCLRFPFPLSPSSRRLIEYLSWTRVKLNPLAWPRQRQAKITQLSPSPSVCVPSPQASYPCYGVPSRVLGPSGSRPSFLFSFLSN